MKNLNLYLYICCFFVCLWYSICLFVFSIPTSKLPIEYTLYYVEKSLRNWPGYHGLEKYKVGKRYSYSTVETMNKNQGIGWSRGEKEFTWMEGNESSIYFKLVNNVKKDLKFTMRYKYSTQNKCTVYINGVRLSEVSLHNGGLCEFNIPSDYITGENLMIKFVFTDVKKISEIHKSTDQRRLTIACQYIELEYI